MGVMGDTTANMRDPSFYRWHKYIDIFFDLYKQTLQPYNPTGVCIKKAILLLNYTISLNSFLGRITISLGGYTNTECTTANRKPSSRIVPSPCKCLTHI
jgi:hypothetical protein